MIAAVERAESKNEGQKPRIRVAVEVPDGVRVGSMELQFTVDGDVVQGELFSTDSLTTDRWRGEQTTPTPTPAPATNGSESPRPGRQLQPAGGPSRPETMVALLSASAPLNRKRQKAGPKQQRQHVTAAEKFDEWWLTEGRNLLRSTEPQQVGMIVALKADSELSKPVARRAFAVFWLTKPFRGKPGRSPKTVAGYWQHIVMVCRAHGCLLEQWTSEEIIALNDSLHGVSDAAPIERREAPTAEELDAMAIACTDVSGPYGEHSPFFMRQLIRWFACFGLRTRDVISMEAGKTGIRKDSIVWTPECPCAKTRAVLPDLESPGGWVWILIHKAKKRKWKWTLLPIPEWSRSWFQFFSEFSHDDVRLFPSSVPGAASLSQAAFSGAWNGVLDSAGVSPHIRLSEGDEQTMTLRKYSANWWRLKVLEHKGDDRLSERVCQYILHHAEITRSTADCNYLSVRATVLPTIIELLPLFPKPAADTPPVSLLPE